MTSAGPSERSFGLSVGLVLAAAGLFRLWRGHSTSGAAFAAIGAALVAAALVAPGALRTPNRVWTAFAHALGWINTRVLLTLFFFLVLTPVGVVLRLLGRSPLAPERATTTWSPSRTQGRDARHYERMF